jgi:hypothetical protein
VVGFRLTPAEIAAVESHQRQDETLGECARRLLLEKVAQDIALKWNRALD